MQPRIILWLVCGVLGVAVYFSQMNLNRINPTLKVKRSVGINTFNEPYVLPQKVLQGGALGFQNTLADYYWLGAIQYFGGGDPFGTYARLAELLNAVTALDPKFAYPYTFGLLVLPDQGAADEAVTLGRRGLENVPQSWEIPYYLGYVYDHYKKDSARAGEMFNRAAENPDAPGAAKLLAGIYYSKAGQREIAIATWKVAAESSTNEYTRERAKLFLDHYALMDFLEQQSGAYKLRWGRFPRTLDELKTGGILKEIPPDPINADLTIDPQTGAVSEVEK